MIETAEMWEREFDAGATKYKGAWYSMIQTIEHLAIQSDLILTKAAVVEMAANIGVILEEWQNED